MTDYTHTANWFYMNIGCPRCPYRQEYCCYYGNEDYERWLND